MIILSIDIGTSSLKAALMDESLNILHTAKVAYQIRTKNIDWVELDAGDVLKAVVEAANQLPNVQEVDLICYDCFSPSLLLMDGDGDALCPILTHLDRRSKKQTQDILRIFGREKFHAIAGLQPFTGGASVTSLLWLKENCAGEWNSAARAGHLVTYIYKKLTGVWAIDPVNASQTGIYETISNRGWSDDICGALEIPAKILPEVMRAGIIAGGLTAEISEMTGIKKGTPVALGTNDATVAQIGAGNRCSGDILNICGSSDMVSILTDKPVIDEKFYTRGFCLPGLWQIYVTTAGGFAVDWFRAQFCNEMDEGRFFGEEFESAAELCTDANLSVGFTPYLAGDRQSLEPKRASFYGLTLDTTRRQMLAALLLAMNGPMRDVIEIAKSHIELSGVIKLVGGMLSPSFVDLKRRLFPDFSFEVYDDCPLIGSADLALRNYPQL